MEESPKKTKKGFIITIICVIVVLAAAVAAYFIIQDLNQRNSAYMAEQAQKEQTRQEIINSGVFHEGITIGGMDVSGMTKDLAKAALRASQDGSSNFVLTLDGQSYTLKAADLGIEYQYDQVIDEAFNVGREGDYDTLMKLMEDLKTNGKDFPVPSTINEATAQTAIANFAAGVDVPAVNATIKLGEGNKVEYVPEQNGVQVDQAALYNTLAERVNNKDYSPIDVPAKVTEPDLKIDELKSKMVKRSEAWTSFAEGHYSRATRVFNITKAAGLVNGTVLKPGQVFSMNGTLGPRTYGLGWKPAPAIIDGGASTEDQAGGGVCQVATTLYDAVLKADLQIVSRRGHSVKLGYVGGGLDATINTGTIDFQFKNNTDSDLLIVAYVADKKVHMELYGEAFTGDFDEIRLTSKHLGAVSPSLPMKVTVDETKAPGYKETVVERSNGSKWAGYKNYYKDGKYLRTVQIDTTIYKAQRGEMIVGPEATPTPTKTTKPTAKPGTTSASPTSAGTPPATTTS